MLCAGLGTRLKPITDDMPKCMVPINGKPMLEHLVEHIKKHDSNATIMINTHYKPDKIMEYFGDRLIYIHEPVLLGDIVSTRRVTNLVDHDMFVMNGDTLTDIDLSAMERDGRDEDSCIAAFDGMTYTGTTFFNSSYPGRIIVKEYGNFWLDIGTHENLAKAREKYESEANLSKLL